MRILCQVCKSGFCMWTLYGVLHAVFKWGFRMGNLEGNSDGDIVQGLWGFEGISKGDFV